MNDLKTLQVICDIIKEYCNLKKEQIYIYNQKYIIPNTTDAFVSVGLMGTTDYANNSINNNENETVYLHKLLSVDINVYSYDFQAMTLKDKISMTFKSYTAEKKQELYAFKIQNQLNWRNINEIDGDKILYRFNTNINVLSMVKNENIIDFYNKQNLNKFIINK